MRTASTCLALTAVAVNGVVDKPNIIYVLTDDQDQTSGGAFPLVDGFNNGATPMPKTQQLMVNEGSMALNFYIHTPVCNPSRSELLSGRYLHNIALPAYGVWSSMGANTTYVNEHNFMKILKEQAGYATGGFGKYTNDMTNIGKLGPGFDAFMMNTGDKYFAPPYYVHGLSHLYPEFEHAEKTGTEYIFPNENYTTSVDGNVSLTWINHVMMTQTGTPFAAYICPRAPHMPTLPAPWYKHHWDPSWPEHPPRNAIFNTTLEQRAHHHAYISTNPQYVHKDLANLTTAFKQRWRTLMSVDDLIHDHVMNLRRLDIEDSTYMLYSADNGYSLGGMQLNVDKLNVYEQNTKLFLLVRGPGVKKGGVFKQPMTQVDLTPTFLGLAGLDKADFHDGKSMVPVIVNNMSPTDPLIPDSVRRHVARLPANYTSTLRNMVYHMYFHVDPSTYWPMGGGTLHPPVGPWGGIDTALNNFIGIHYFDESGELTNMKYTEFYEGVERYESISFAQNRSYHTEITNFTSDPWELDNLWPQNHSSKVSPVNQAQLEKMAADLRKFYNCKGDSCP